MKLVTFCHNQQTRIGAVDGDSIIDAMVDSSLQTTMIDFLVAGAPALQRL